MLQTCIIKLTNNYEYSIDAENAAYQQMDELNNEIDSIKNYSLLKTEKEDKFFTTSFIVDFEGYTYNDLKNDIDWSNLNHLKNTISYDFN